MFALIKYDPKSQIKIHVCKSFDAINVADAICRKYAVAPVEIKIVDRFHLVPSHLGFALATEPINVGSFGTIHPSDVGNVIDMLRNGGKEYDEVRKGLRKVYGDSMVYCFDFQYINRMIDALSHPVFQDEVDAIYNAWAARNG